MAGNTNLFQVPLLTTLAVMFKPMGFIAQNILTPVMVGVTQVQYVEWNRDGMYRVPHTKLSPSANVNLIEVEGTIKTLNLFDHGLGSYTDQREFKQGGGGLPVLAIKNQHQKAGLMLREETDVATALRDTNVITQNETLNGAAQWNDPASNPRTDVRRWARACKMRPNFGAMSRDVFDTLAEHPKVLDAIKYTNLGVLTKQLLAAMFDLEDIYVADGLVNTAEKGQAEAVSRIWGKDFILGYHTKAPPSPLLDQPTCGYMVRLGDAMPDMTGTTAHPDGQMPSYRVYVAPPDPRLGTAEGSTFTKTETSFDAAITARDMIFLGKNVVA